MILSTPFSTPSDSCSTQLAFLRTHAWPGWSNVVDMLDEMRYGTETICAPLTHQVECIQDWLASSREGFSIYDLRPIARGFHLYTLKCGYEAWEEVLHVSIRWRCMVICPHGLAAVSQLIPSAALPHLGRKTNLVKVRAQRADYHWQAWTWPQDRTMQPLGGVIIPADETGKRGGATPLGVTSGGVARPRALRRPRRGDETEGNCGRVGGATAKQRAEAAQAKAGEAGRPPREGHSRLQCPLRNRAPSSPVSCRRFVDHSRWRVQTSEGTRDGGRTSFLGCVAADDIAWFQWFSPV